MRVTRLVTLPLSLVTLLLLITLGLLILTLLLLARSFPFVIRALLLNLILFMLDPPVSHPYIWMSTY